MVWLLLAVALAGCAAPETRDLKSGFILGFSGGVVADEPRAALIGRDILNQGGNAADAAVAIYFAMAVTLPSAASLGGGGVCLVHDPENARTEAIEFLARAPAAPKLGTLPAAVPGNVRGMFALHARAGKLRWSQLLMPAFVLARDGYPVTRALARSFDLAADRLLEDREARRIFARSDGSLVKEGQVVEQVALASVLSVLRTLGPGDFYSGQLARGLVEAAGEAGLGLSITDLREYRPRLVAPIATRIGPDLFYATPPPGGGGVLAAQVLAMMRKAGGRVDARDHLFADAVLLAASDRGRWRGGDGALREPLDSLVAGRRIESLLASYDSDRHLSARGLDPAPDPMSGAPGAAGLVTVDKQGQAVACSFSLNRPFGLARVVPGYGIVLAAPPSTDESDADSLAAAMIVNPKTQAFRFAAIASGDASAPARLADIALRVLKDETPLAEALARPRVYPLGAPDLLLAEPGVPLAARQALEAKGHTLKDIERLGRVSAVSCPGGLPRFPACQIEQSPRGYGLFAESSP